MPVTDPIGSDEHKALVDELRATAPVASERLRQRVLELAPSPRRRMSGRRQLALAVVPVAVVLAGGAALVHGFVSSGSQQASLAPAFGVPRGTPHGSAATTAATPLSGHSTTTQAAGGAPGTAQAYQGTLTKSSGLSQKSGGELITIPTNRLVHADATLLVQVHDRAALEQATNAATQIVSSLGGYAQSVHYESSHDGTGSAVLALRVPVRKAQAAIAKLEGLGALLSQQLSTQDLQQQLTHQTNQIDTLRRAIAVYEQALQNPSLSAPDRVTIQIRLENARHSLAQLRKARSGTVAAAATADVSLTLTTKQHQGVVAPGRQGRFDRMLGSAAGFLGLEGMIVLYALVVLSPVLILGGLGWALVRERRRRNERHLLAPS